MKFLISLLLGLIAGTALAPGKTELTMYYPIAVGGPLTDVVDGMVAGFEAENPDIKVNAVYAGNYDDARIGARGAEGRPAGAALGAVLHRRLRSDRAGPDRALR